MNIFHVISKLDMYESSQDSLTYLVKPHCTKQDIREPECFETEKKYIVAILLKKRGSITIENNYRAYYWEDEDTKKDNFGWVDEFGVPYSDVTHPFFGDDEEFLVYGYKEMGDD
jgi:hypothetical protein